MKSARTRKNGSKLSQGNCSGEKTINNGRSGGSRDPRIRSCWNERIIHWATQSALTDGAVHYSLVPTRVPLLILSAETRVRVPSPLPPKKGSCDVIFDVKSRSNSRTHRYSSTFRITAAVHVTPFTKKKASEVSQQPFL